MWAVIILAVIFGSDIWNSKWRYAIFNGLSRDEIEVQGKPSDCDFSRAPLGYKGCHYQKQVTRVRWATSTQGDPIVSYDDGKTWMPFTPPAGHTVPKYPTVMYLSVGWEKIKDD